MPLDGKIDRKKSIPQLPSVLEAHLQLTRSGKTVYLDHTIRVSSKKDTEEGYIIEGGEIRYCEFRRTGLALVLIYLQRMLLLES